MNSEIQNKISIIKTLFLGCHSREAIYLKIMELGQKLRPLDLNSKTEDNIVPGCQSVMYLKTTIKEGILFFEAESNALISSGLAYLLIHVYSGETAETILTQSPTFLAEMGIYSSLSLNRSNGLSQIFFKMKKEALKTVLKKSIPK